MSDDLTRLHGGIDPREFERLGIDPNTVLDLSVNVNPFGPHPNVREAIRRAAIDQYPDTHAELARRAIAHAEDIDPARVLIGHGSAELLWLAVATLSGSERPLLIATPTFCEPELAARAFRVPVVHCQALERDGFAHTLPALDAAIGAHDPAAVYLCQPNNPSGACQSQASVRALCQAHPRTLFVLDQAFLSLSTHHAEHAVRFDDNVLVIRSLTKDHALPGLRVGYAVCTPSRALDLAARRPSWMISAPAQAAIIAACARQDHVRDTRERWLEDTRELAAACQALGWGVVPSQTPFFLMKVGAADALRERLLVRQRVLVRSARSFGLGDYIRIAGCSTQQRPRVLAALRAECTP